MKLKYYQAVIHYAVVEMCRKAAHRYRIKADIIDDSPGWRWHG